MLNRRHLRIRVLQFVYSWNKSNGVEIVALEKQFLKSLTKVEELYLLLLMYVLEVRDYAENYLVHNKGIESVGAGEAVMISGSSGLEPKAQISMSVGDKVLSANITGLPDSDTASEYLLWEYTGSDITSQLTLATSSVSAVGSGSYIQWVSIQANNGLDNPVTMTPSHTILTWSGSSYPNTGSWYFEYAGDVVAGMKFLSSSMEVIDVTKWTYVTSSVSQSFYRTNIEPHDVYFIDGVLVHN